jgi:hypothetical protein
VMLQKSNRNAHLGEAIPVREVVDRVHDVKRIDAGGVDVRGRCRRGRGALRVVEDEARCRLGRRGGLRTLEGDGVVAAVRASVC